MTSNQIKEYWDASPCNIRHSALPIGTIDYFQQVTARKYKVEPHILPFVDFPSWRNKRVLEIGCGIGTAMITFLQHGVSHYTGVDISEASIKIAKQRYELYDTSSMLNGNKATCELIQGNWEDMPNSRFPVPEKRYDLIYSFGVLHHMEDIDRAFGRIPLYSGPNTKLKIMLYAHNSWKSIMIDEGLDQFEAQDNVPVALRFSRPIVHGFLHDINFVTTKIEQAHIFPYEVESYKRYIYRKTPYFESMPPEVFAALEKHLGWHLLIDAEPVRARFNVT